MARALHWSVLMKIETSLRTLSFLLALSTLPCAGCLSKGEPAVLDGGPESTLQPANGWLNGVSLNGTTLNGVNFNGVSLNGVSLNGVQLNGAVIDGVAVPQLLELRGAELVAFPAGGGMLGGEDLEGTALTGELSNGGALQLEIADVAPTADPEIYEYAVIYWDGTSWANLCGESNGTPVRALALAGAWDPSSGTPTGGDHIDDPDIFTFACKSAVVAKCVGLGYAPWRAITECVDSDCHTVPMRDMHQACTRMMRADYCGDGTPHTQNGTAINVWDNFDVQVPDVVLPVTWNDEAEWSPNGALCIEQVRWSGAAETYITQHCSDRWTSPSFECFGEDSTLFTKAGFGTPLAGRSLIRSQFTHDPLP
jgi:ADYC domain/Pentapeptide repeats (8 copies)